MPEGLPPGHAGYGKPVGSRYRIDFNRWPRTWLGWQQLPPVDQIGRILSHDAFVDFYLPIDLAPEIVEAQVLRPCRPWPPGQSSRQPRRAADRGFIETPLPKGTSRPSWPP